MPQESHPQMSGKEILSRLPSMFQAIAAMSENRIIGANGKIPWHIPEDFRWFKHKTMGGTLIMGRKTFESIGKPLPGRKTLVISRSFQSPNVASCDDLVHLDDALAALPAPYWVCGGAEIYRQLLPRCDVLYLTRVKREIAGDAFFPEDFDREFGLNQIIHTDPAFQVERWTRREKEASLRPPGESWPVGI